jgi:hypothetical protein
MNRRDRTKIHRCQQCGALNRVHLRFLDPKPDNAELKPDYADYLTASCARCKAKLPATLAKSGHVTVELLGDRGAGA